MPHTLLQLPMLAVVLVASGVLASCDECEKSVSLKTWCRDDPIDQCRGLQTYDGALGKLTAVCRQSWGRLVVTTCDDATLLSTSDGFVGRTLGYDADGELVYGQWSTDAPEGCPLPQGGRRLDMEGCSRCVLCATASGLSDGYEACDPKLAPQLEQACIAGAPNSFQGACRSCACEACYPFFAPADSDVADRLARDFVDCAMERCEQCMEPHHAGMSQRR